MKELKPFKKDEYVFKEGDVATEFYMVTKGTFRVSQFRNQVEHVKRGRLIVGDVFGELSLFDGKRRAYNLIAEQDSEVLVIPYDAILQHSNEIPEWAVALMKTLIDHFRRLMIHVKEEDEVFSSDNDSIQKPKID